MMVAIDDVRSALRAAVRSRYDPESEQSYVDTDGWYADPSILSALGGALSSLFAQAAPTVVVGPASSGYLLGALTAEHLAVPFVRARKDPARASDSDRWRSRTTPPDYRDRHLQLGWRDRLIRPGDRVLAVDDLVDTGGQLFAIRAVVDDIGATWVGASVVLDNLTRHEVRRDLGVRALLNGRDIG